MIVTCEQCSTQFQLDDSKVPERGVRVRCSRCKHAFTVKPPTEAGDPVERAVERSIDDTSDFAAGPMADQLGDQGADTAPLDELVEESDWEFNHDPGAERQPETEVGAPEAGPDLAQDAVDDLLDAPGEDFSQTPSGPVVGIGEDVDSLFAGAEDDPLSSGADVDSLSAGAEDDSLSAGAEDDSLSAGAEDDSLSTGHDDDLSPFAGAPSALEIGSDPSVGFGELGADPLDSDPLDSGSGLDDSIGGEPLAEDVGVDEPLAGEIDAGEQLSDLAPPEPVSQAQPADEPGERPETPSPQAQAASDGLGSPENWDFFDEGDAPPAPRVGMKIALGRIGVARSARPPVEVESEPSQAAIWLERGVHGVGWAVVALLALAGLHGGLGAAGKPTREAPGLQRIVGLELSGVRGGWTENAVAGPVYVISAQLRNADAAWITPGSRLAVQLLDDRGGLVGDEVAAVGAGLSVEQLRLARPDELEARLAANANAMAWTPLAPGRTQVLRAVLPALPEAATRFAIVAVPVERARPVGSLEPEPATRSGAGGEAEPRVVRAPAGPATRSARP